MQIIRASKEWLLYYFSGLYHRAARHHIFLLGGGLAFSLFVCAIPLTLVISWILGELLEAASVQGQITALVDRVIPYSNYASFVKTIISSRIDEVVAHKNVAGYLGFFALLFAASGLFSSMRTILNTIFEVGSDESIVLGKLKDFGLVLLVLVFTTASIAVLPIFEILKDSADKFTLLKFLQFSGFEHFLLFLISYLVMFALFFFLYYLIPYQRVGYRVVIVSALWASLLWELAKQLFGYYITHVATLGQIYGTYLLVIVVGFWIYYSSLTFILGAEIGELYRERRQS